MSEDGVSLLQWHVEPTQDATILHTTGEIDLSTQPEFSDAVRAAMRTAARLIVVDLSDVIFIGSTGLQLLLNVHDEARRDGRRLHVAHGNSQARRIFEISGIQHVLAVYDTLEDALGDDV